MGRPSAEMIDAVNELAAANNWSPQDIMTVFSYETGGTMDPWQKGPTTKWGQHRGLIQWGEEQRNKYGVSQDTPVRDQVMAAGRYFKDRGVKEGDGLLPMYASVNAGHASKIHASDEAAGGAPGTVLDKVRDQMGGHQKNAAGWLGKDYVPSKSDNRSQDESSVPTIEASPDSMGVPEMADSLTPPPIDMLDDPVGWAKQEGKGFAQTMAKKGIQSLLGGGGNDTPLPPPPPLIEAAPIPRRGAPRGPVVLVQRKEKKK